MTISYDTIFSELNWKIPVQMYCTSSIKNTGIFFNLELKKRWESSTYCYKDLCRPDQIRLLPVSSPILKYKKKRMLYIHSTHICHPPAWFLCSPLAFLWVYPFSSLEFAKSRNWSISVHSLSACHLFGFSFKF